MKKQELAKSFLFSISFLGISLLFRELGLFWEHTPETLYKIIGQRSL